MVVDKGQVVKNAVFRIGLSLIVMSLILFLSSGSLKYSNAWLFLLSFYTADVLLTIYLYFKDIELLHKRLKIAETEKVQKLFNIFYFLIIILVLIFSGLNYRFDYYHVPFWVSLLSTVIMVCGYIFSLIVMKQNSYSSRVIEIQENQSLIDTGLYSVIRHPMYLSAILIYCPIPLILGSLYVFIFIMFLIPIALGVRILDEEKMLQNGLEGYSEYMTRVKYRLIPYVW